MRGGAMGPMTGAIWIALLACLACQTFGMRGGKRPVQVLFSPG